MKHGILSQIITSLPHERVVYCGKPAIYLFYVVYINWKSRRIYKRVICTFYSIIIRRMGSSISSRNFKMKIWKIIAVITIAKFCKSNIGLTVESRLVSNTGDESELEAASHMSKQDLEDSIGKKN